MAQVESTELTKLLDIGGIVKDGWVTPDMDSGSLEQSVGVLILQKLSKVFPGCEGGPCLF